jgi:hypothetical protein
VGVDAPDMLQARIAISRALVNVRGSWRIGFIWNSIVAKGLFCRRRMGL